MTGLGAVPLLLLLLLAAAAARAHDPAEEQEADARRFGARRARSLGLLAAALKERVDDARHRSDQLDLVFLIDASASVGEANFRGELNFVRKLLSDFTMGPGATRVSIVTFAGRGEIVRHVDYVSRRAGHADKCQLLNKQLDSVVYTGGGTYTYGALMEAFAILENSRRNSEKLVFLVTDGFSNGADPRHAANLLKGLGVTIFTFGIQTGNVDELRDIASEPSYVYSYFLNSFLEFEALARKALHRDLRAGKYAAVEDPRECEPLCAGGRASNGTNCCDPIASCGCGTASGHYACLCPAGYFGSGLLGNCQPCPNGTYGFRNDPTDLSVSCASCPDANHVTLRIPAISSKDCICASGFIADRGACEAITCPKLKVPENGYFVKANACNNVVNAACGIRCRIGFHLTGDSIRLCSKNGNWTGEETQCLVKTCAALRAPTNGRIRCEHENHRIRVNDKTAQPIDTRCQFKCENGFQLRGSKVRNCLPLSRWDGLKTTCKPIYCEPLRPVVNAEIHPKNCQGPRKLPYASNCTITCKKGYKLEGPRTRMCVGRHGTWSKRHSVSRCIDKTRPVLICPVNMTVATLPGKNYTFVHWSVPSATDNSGLKCNVWSKPHVTFPWKVHLGKHTVKYIAQDVSGNKARCFFNVHVVDEEPPKMENCKNSRLFITGSEKNLKDFTWDEPIFYDNSGHLIKVNRTIHSTVEPFTVGEHTVLYSASDKYENTVKCFVNLTIQDACNNIPKPLNGRTECVNIENEGKRCSLFCDPGYTFAFNISTFKLQKNQTAQVITCDLTSHTWNTNIIPDCTATKVPDTILQEGSVILDGHRIDCDNTSLVDNLTRYIKDNYEVNMMSLCGNDLQCTIKNEVECKQFLARASRSIVGDFYPNKKRYSSKSGNRGSDRSDRLRNLMKKEQIEIKFAFIAKIIEENQNNSRLGIIRLREKIQSMVKSGELNLLDNDTNREIGKLALNLHTIFKHPLEICDNGRVLRKNDCVKCPAGTFHNVTRGQCQSCFYGEYQNEVGSTKCEKCPENYHTRRTHARSPNECIQACQPGHYSRRRHQPELPVALAPCITCEIGFYQPHYGQSQCLPCPRSTITERRAATAAADCQPLNRSLVDVCRTNPCLNGAVCLREKDGFSCECLDHYVGSRCEIFVNPCASSPCSSAGQCILRNSSDHQWAYVCACKPGYTGTYCETLINECSYSPCRNGGTCLSTDIDITCTCRDGFEGDFCEVAVNHCSPSPCEMNSTCRSVNGTWKCLCSPGYLGLRCNLLPCDWLPCHPNEICVNVERENADKSDYRCECPPGFTGKFCQTRIDHCENQPCSNDGTCINNLLNYTCNCLVPFTGANCEIELSSNYVMHFTRSGTTNYASVPGPSKNLSQLTVCFWLQSIDAFNYGTVVSYATPGQDNALTITDYNGFVLYVNGEKVITDARMNDGYWHFICVCWENKLGSWRFYVDGALRDNGTFLARNTEIPARGTFVFGQEQDEVGGGFSESESFLGKLFSLDIWDTAEGPDFVDHLSRTCEKYHGSVVAWAQLQEHVKGDVELVESSFCQGCPPPVAPYKGYVNVSQDGLDVIYSCETGYEFRKNYEHHKTLRKTCLKHGNWEGAAVPSCVRVVCPFPGYFLRGQIIGRSYMYGDTIFYQCNEGYSLRGNTQRICKADGRWSGGTPFCIGKTCRNLLAPDHGDIEYIISEHDRDDLSILQVGHQLEFKCDPGFYLSGQKLLTCLENGTWDFKRPSCIPMGCPSPKPISHGRIVANSSLEPSELGGPLRLSQAPSYFYGDVVAFACESGYKFDGNHNLLAQFKLQCASSGAWTGLVPDCVPLRCPPPQPPPNARIYLTNKDQLEVNTSSASSLPEEQANWNNSLIEVNTNSSEDLAQYFVPGAQIKIVCDQGYEAKGDSAILDCTEKELWSGEEVRCELSRCSLESHPIIGLFANENATRTPTESQDSSFDELDLADSENSSDPSLRLSKTFNFYLEGNAYGQRASLQCKWQSSRESLINGSSAAGSLELVWRCGEDGSWKFASDRVDERKIVESLLDDKKSICKERCGLPKIPLHGYVVNETRIKNPINAEDIEQSVTFKCDQGFDLKGPDKSFCLPNGTWSRIPYCEPINCENPPVVPNAELRNGKANIDLLPMGSTVTYQCLPGYRMFGQLSTQCLASGEWSQVNGRCGRISCGKPKLTSGASLQGNSYFYQDRLIYVCPGGKFRDMIVCNQDGRWSTLPTCTENN